ncbi:kinesin heavy chain, putative [Perkinsus marinus ATCC 50983]|uniref:Kinesin-like protein n=1 Tax=Perkinsus marinus (strain ATCC 50983 / TXsc) TaxID=423536 RepID=C5KXS4_PERM5|nr:kinesin heavy chain, putative [Perkinsus marinus ATCC 50983]EER10798.1 kinesin heavy chain, putative [Perkinsus marinus ATCC 50983]|eukprot:XP_002779003.1 kinesin heavy chain, putative [Perkinsus marinus ATCC 50983]
MAVSREETQAAKELTTPAIFLQRYGSPTRQELLRSRPMKIRRESGDRSSPDQSSEMSVASRLKAVIINCMLSVRPLRQGSRSQHLSFSLLQRLGSYGEQARVSDCMKARLRQVCGFSSSVRRYDENFTQPEVYERTAREAVRSVLQGFNATILAYGQTGTGKTHTMEGFITDYYNDVQRGIIPRSMAEIFEYIACHNHLTFTVRASYLQIYNETVSDLLPTVVNPPSSNLNIRHDTRRGVYVDGLSEYVVREPGEVYDLMRRGNASRAIATTKLNDASSRSHAVFMMTVEMCNDEDSTTRVGKLNLVDLAGSERVRLTGATGTRLEESKKINQSLSALGNVIAALTEASQVGGGGRSHIPYRDSKLTRLLEDSLGGNCITVMIAMISPAAEAFGESLSTLKFANRARSVRNTPVLNEYVSEQEARLRKYEIEIQKLRSQLAQKLTIDMSDRQPDRVPNDSEVDVEGEIRSRLIKTVIESTAGYKTLLALTTRLDDRDQMVLQLQRSKEDQDKDIKRLQEKIADLRTRQLPRTRSHRDLSADPIVDRIMHRIDQILSPEAVKEQLKQDVHELYRVLCEDDCQSTPPLIDYDGGPGTEINLASKANININL